MRWVLELREVDAARFAKPPEEKLASDYPLSMVDHAKERQVALERFGKVLLGLAWDSQKSHVLMQSFQSLVPVLDHEPFHG
jgi:hypothetical protein